MIRPRKNRLRSDHRAAAAIEFAMICAPFVIFFMAIFGVAFHFYVQQALDYTTQSAARQVRLGKIPPGYTEADFVNKIFCPLFGPFQACANIYVDVHPVTDYGQLTLPGVPDAPDSTATTGLSFCSGSPGQLMYVHVIYLAPSIGGALLGQAAAGDAIVANAAFANENPVGSTVVQANGC